jgi:uncharacterized membrane protein (DUF4010 family)
VRTFALSGVLGGIVAALAQDEAGTLDVKGTILIGTAFLAYAAVIAVFNRDENQAASKFSATTTVAALLTFMLGAYALVGEPRVAAAVAVATAGVLFVREELHGWIAKISPVELQSGLVLLAMTVIALPIVPDRAFPQLAGLNPREIWLIAIVLAGVSFAGYVIVKAYGESRGILLAAAAGGLVSSTAVTFYLARRVRGRDSLPRLLASAASLATAVSFIRVAAIVLWMKPSIVSAIAPGLASAAIVATACALLPLYWRHREVHGSSEFMLRNPFGLVAVVTVAATMGVLIVVGRIVQERFGAQGATIGAGAMGFFDVDAMAVSMSKLVPESLSVRAGAFAILTGVTANTLSKVVIAALLGRGSFAFRYTAISIACMLIAWVVTLPIAAQIVRQSGV